MPYTDFTLEAVEATYRVLPAETNVLTIARPGRTYRTLARFAAHQCAAAHDYAEPGIHEAWMASEIVSWLNHNMAGRKYLLESFSPDEYKTGRAGKQHCIDIVGRPVGKPSSGDVSALMEVKLMLDRTRPWAYEIVTDVLRLAGIRKWTLRTTDRHVMVVGQKQAWERAEVQCDGLLGKVCPQKEVPNYWMFGLLPKSTKTALTQRWIEANLKQSERYLVGRLPSYIKVQLVGFHEAVNPEEPELSIVARIWRIRVGGQSTAVTTTPSGFGEPEA